MDTRGRTPPPPPKARHGHPAADDRSKKDNKSRRQDPLPDSGPVEEESRQGIEAERIARTAGADGVTHIRIEMIEVPLGRDVSCRFRIHTEPEHALEATLTQKSWEKQYVGIGTLETDVVPVAGVGVQGLLVVRDTVTGETAEQPWHWYRIGLGSLFGALWRLVKWLFRRGGR